MNMMQIPTTLLIRDLAVLAVTMWLWILARHLEALQSLLTVPAALIGGVMIALCGYLAHEWGHLLGALFSRSRVELPQRLDAVFLFKFDTGLNSREQFLSMSMGGFIASALVVLLLVSKLSFSYWVDLIALILTALGVLATAVLELPPAWRVYRGAALPQQGPAFVDGRKPH
jgi:hypothetical protein